MNDTRLSYKGEVQIHIKGQKPERKKNAGTSFLFTLLSEVLTTIVPVTDTKFSSKFPTWFTFVSDVSENELANGVYSDVAGKTLLLRDILIRSRNIITEGEFGVNFSGLLTYDMLNTTKKPSNNTPIYVVMLDNQEDKHILAFSSVSSTTIIPLFDDVTSQATIDWQMYFDNEK